MPILTPGAAAAGTLDQILTQRKAEARQAMLDQLNQKNVDSEIASRDENAKSSALYRQMQASQLKSQEEQRKVGMIDSISPGVDSDVTGMFSPDVEHVGEQFGRLRKQEVINSEGTDTVPHVFSRGNPQQQREHSIDQSIDETTPSMLNAVDPKNRALVEALIKSHRSTHTILSPAEMTPFIRGNQSQAAVVFGRDGKYHTGNANGPVIDSIPSGAHVQSMPAPPAAHAPNQYTGKDKDGTEHTFLVDDKGQKVTEINIPGITDLRHGNPLATPTNKPIINETTARNLAKLHAVAMTTGSEKDKNNFYSNVSMMVTNSGASDEIKQVLAQIIADAHSGNPDPRPTQQIIDESTQGASPEEKHYFSTLLRAITQEQ